MLDLKRTCYLAKAMMIIQLSGGLFIPETFIIWGKVIVVKMIYCIYLTNSVLKMIPIHKEPKKYYKNTKVYMPSYIF